MLKGCRLLFDEFLSAYSLDPLAWQCHAPCARIALRGVDCLR